MKAAIAAPFPQTDLPDLEFTQLLILARPRRLLISNRQCFSLKTGEVDDMTGMIDVDSDKLATAVEVQYYPRYYLT